jgi:acetyl esterase/lipase
MTSRWWRDARRLLYFRGANAARATTRGHKESRMSTDKQEPMPITKRRVVFTMPNLGAVTVRRDQTYRTTDAGPQTLDLYYPHDSHSGTPRPAVIVVAGYADGGARPGSASFKNMGWTVSWAELIAASGMVAITYSNQHPADDAAAVLAHVHRNATALGIDTNRVALFAGSGNAPVALALLMNGPGQALTCAVLCYPMLLDAEGTTFVADAARTYGFANPCAGRSVSDLPPVALMIVRASDDQFPHVNDTIDRFLADAGARQLPVTLVRHEGPHAFDLLQDTDAARDTIKQMLAFLRGHLLRENT